MKTDDSFGAPIEAFRVFRFDDMNTISAWEERYDI